MIRKVQHKDIIEFYGKPLKPTIRGVVSVSDSGEIMGIAGYYTQNRYSVLFSEFKEGISKRDIVVGGKILMEEFKRRGAEVFAHSDAVDKTLVKHFNFKPVEGHDSIWRLAL